MDLAWRRSRTGGPATVHYANDRWQVRNRERRPFTERPEDDG